MRGKFYRRGCTCDKEPCTCGSKWAIMIDMGVDQVSGVRKQKQITGFKTLKEAQKVAAVFLQEMNNIQNNEKTEINVLSIQLASVTGLRASELLSLKNGRKDA